VGKKASYGDRFFILGNEAGEKPGQGIVQAKSSPFQSDHAKWGGYQGLCERGQIEANGRAYQSAPGFDSAPGPFEYHLSVPRDEKGSAGEYAFGYS
jgi:hypothetical protein